MITQTPLVASSFGQLLGNKQLQIYQVPDNIKALKCKPSAQYTRHVKSAALPCPNIAYGRDVLLLTCVILSERGIYGSLLRKTRRLEYLVAYLCFR